MSNIYEEIDAYFDQKIEAENKSLEEKDYKNKKRYLDIVTKIEKEMENASKIQYKALDPYSLFLMCLINNISDKYTIDDAIKDVNALDMDVDFSDIFAIIDSATIKHIIEEDGSETVQEIDLLFEALKLDYFDEAALDDENFMNRNREYIKALKIEGIFDTILKYQPTLKKFLKGKHPSHLLSLIYTKENFDHCFSILTGVKVLTDDKECKELKSKSAVIGYMKRHIIEILTKFREIKLELSNEIKQAEEQIRKVEREREKTKESVKKEFNKKPVVITESLLKLISDPSLKIKILKEGMNANRGIFVKDIVDNEAEKKRSVTQKILDTYRINTNRFSKEELEKILNLSPTDLEDMLKLLSQNKLTTNKEFDLYDVLTKANKDTIKNILKELNNKKISQEFIINNPSIFYTEEHEDSKYLDFTENMKHLLENKFNTYLMSETCPELLLGDHKRIERALFSYAPYNLDYRKLTRFDLLKYNLLEAIDDYIELSKYELVRSNPNLINTDFIASTNKGFLYKQLNMDIEDSLFNGEDFITIGTSTIGKDTIASSIDKSCSMEILPQLRRKLDLNVANIKTTKPASLEKYKVNDAVYDINGVLVSRPKVMRNYNVIMNEEAKEYDILLAAILHNSFYSPKEIETIKTRLKFQETSTLYKIKKEPK